MGSCCGLICADFQRCDRSTIYIKWDVLNLTVLGCDLMAFVSDCGPGKNHKLSKMTVKTTIFDTKNSIFDLKNQFSASIFVQNSSKNTVIPSKYT